MRSRQMAHNPLRNALQHTSGGHRLPSCRSMSTTINGYSKSPTTDLGLLQTSGPPDRAILPRGPDAPARKRRHRSRAVPQPYHRRGAWQLATDTQQSRRGHAFTRRHSYAKGSVVIEIGSSAVHRDSLKNEHSRPTSCRLHLSSGPSSLTSPSYLSS